LLAWLDSHGEVLSRQFSDDRVRIHCRIPAAILGRIDPAEAVVTPHEPAAGPAMPPGASAGLDPLATGR